MIDFKKKPIFGMIHLGGERKIERALQEIDIYVEEGVDGCIIENYHGSVTDVILVLHELSLLPKKNILIGINILPNEYDEAFKIANHHDVDFIQLDYVSGTYNDGDTKLDFESYIRGCAELKPSVDILGGVWPKYYTPVKGSDIKDDLVEALFLCDGIVVTGSGTGKETPLDKIKMFKTYISGNRKFGRIPVIIGAGLDARNVAEQLPFADGAIVGSCFKPYKRTNEMIDRKLVREFMDEVNKIRCIVT